MIDRIPDIGCNILLGITILGIQQHFLTILKVGIDSALISI